MTEVNEPENVEKPEPTEEPPKPEYAIDVNAIKQDHHWIDRGAKMTCEGAGHPYHEAWKRK